MLDFLRRKERRKQPSQPNVSSSPANIVKYPAASASVSSGPTSTVSSPPNAHHAYRQQQSSSAQRHHDQQPQQRSTPSVTVNNNKEHNNAVDIGVGMQHFQFHQQQDQAEHVAPEHRGQQQGQLSCVQRHKNTTQQQQNNMSEPALGQCTSTVQNENSTSGGNDPVGETPATATDGTEKLNRQFKNRHESVMLNKAESSGQSRSLKASSLTVPAETAAATTTKLSNATSTTTAATGSTNSLSAFPAQQQVAVRSVEQQQQLVSLLAAQHASQEELATPSPAVQIGCPVPWTSWPHLDLAGVLKKHNDTNLTNADTYISRLAYMASHEESWQQKMIHDGVALTLTTLLSHPHATLAMRQNAMFAIAELAVSEEGEEALVKAGAIYILVWFIDTTNHWDMPILMSACRALRNLLSYSEPTAVLAARHGCVDPLLTLLGSGQKTERGCAMDPDVAVEAVAAVSNLVQHGDKFQSYVLIKHGGLAALVVLGCFTDNDEVLFHVVNIMADCAKDSRWHKVIVDKGGLRVALRALRSAQSPDVSAEAARLIGNIAVTSKARVAAHENGSVTAIIDLLLQQYPCSANNTNISSSGIAQQENTPQNNQEGHAATESSSTLPPAFKSPLLAFDLLRALANVCADPRAASDILAHEDVTRTMLAIYTADRAPEVLVNASFHTLVVLARGFALWRARVLYGIGVQLKRVIVMGDMFPKRLYDLRQAILEQVESG